ncbi:hypothetical protein OJ253_1456 [Cryptosporidium canis]|uniref:HEAT repeat-containing protein 1 n=1 Tax=Cryptosporidium canis TaxID=195482 RepID=A0A9D5DNN0_9CRYT|nr:hypothetical protein OJ253_1456 [Cryptosporidium canis]
MSTELQKQINFQLRRNELAFLSQRALQVNKGRKGKVSFLFDTNTEFYARRGVVADSRIPIFEDVGRLRLLGEQGLLELESLNPRIAHQGFNELFEQAEVVSIQLLTKEETEERLDKLRKFIDFLVPHFLLDSAKICIEYLIQAYDVNVLLGEYLFYSFLPYHDMAEFCQLVRVLDIPDGSQAKGITDSIKSTRAVISSRSHLSAIFLRNPILFKGVVEFWEARLRTFSQTKNVALTNLITWLLIELIEDLSRSKDLRNLNFFLENIIEIIIFGSCLKDSQYEDLRSTAYCILYKLSTPVLNISKETQVRMIQELLRSISRNHSSAASYLPETILLMNHMLTQFGTLSHLETLDSKATEAILSHQQIFIHAFKQLLNWNSDFLQAFTLITKSIVHLGVIQGQNHHHSKSSRHFVQEIINHLGDESVPISSHENISPIIHSIILIFVDLYSPEKASDPYILDIFKLLHSNFQSELLSAVSFALSASSSSYRSAPSQLEEKAQNFLDAVLQQESIQSQSSQPENSRMFLTLLNHPDPSVLNSCFDMIIHLARQSHQQPDRMTVLERSIFDLSLKHFNGYSNHSQNQLFEEFALKLFTLQPTITISQFLDFQDTQSKWRVPLIFKALIGYLQYKATSTYSSLPEFIHKQVNGTFHSSLDVQDIVMESVFSQIFTTDFNTRLCDLFKSLTFILEHCQPSASQAHLLDILPLGHLEILFSILIFTSSGELPFSVDLREVSSGLISVLSKKDQVQAYLKSILDKSSPSFLEFSIILWKLSQLNRDLDVLPNSSFSDFGIQLDHYGQVAQLLESLYYNFYYHIHAESKQTHLTVGVFALALFRSVFQRVLAKDDHLFDSQLLNISLVDTLDTGLLSKHHLGLPVYNLIQRCLHSDHQLASLIVHFSRNLLNIISQSRSLKSSIGHLANYSPFYGSNVYTDMLISHSFSFLEILISKMAVSSKSIRDSLRVLYSVLVYSIIPAFLSQGSKSIKQASFRLCKAAKEQFQKVSQKSSLRFSDVLLSGEEDHQLDLDPVRKCYLDQFGPGISQVLNIIDAFLSHQSEVLVENLDRNLLEIIHAQEARDVFEVILTLNLVMILEMVQDDKGQYIRLNSEYLSDYISGNLNYSSESGSYHGMIVEILRSFSRGGEVRSVDLNQQRLLVILSFVKQGIQNLVNYSKRSGSSSLPGTIEEYIRLVKELRCVKERSQAREIWGDILLLIISRVVTGSIDDDEEFISLVMSVVSQISRDFPERIKEISLSQCVGARSAAARLDLLVARLLKMSADSYPHDEFTEQIILEWVYCDLNMVSLEALDEDSSQDHGHDAGRPSKCLPGLSQSLIEQILDYLRQVNGRLTGLKGNAELEKDRVFKIQIYLVRILEFAVQRGEMQPQEVEETVLAYFDIARNHEISVLLSNPMVMSCIISLFSNIRLADGAEPSSRTYLRVCEVLLSLYHHLIRDNLSSLHQVHFLIKSTLYSLGMFVDHFLGNALCLDSVSKERVKYVLFNALVGQQIQRIAQEGQFDQISDLLSLMEMLYGQIIYKNSTLGFNRIYGIFMVLKSYSSLHSNSTKCIRYMMRHQLLETNIGCYNQLLASILREMEIVFNHPSESSKILLYNLMLMVQALVYLLSYVLLNVEFQSSEVASFIQVFDHLVLIKTLMSKKVFKRLHVSENLDRGSSVLDQLEERYLFISSGPNSSETHPHKTLQKDIDSLIRSILESPQILRSIFIHWDLSKSLEFQIPDSSRSLLSHHLLKHKVDYFALILEESLEKKIKISASDHELVLISSHIQYMLSQDSQFFICHSEKHDFRNKFKIWVKYWHIIHLILQLVPAERFDKFIFSRILEFYKAFQSKEDDQILGIVFKLPVIHYYLVNRMEHLDQKHGLTVLGEIQFVLNDSIGTLKLLNRDIQSNFIHDKKVLSTINSMIISTYGMLDQNQNQDQDQDQNLSKTKAPDTWILPYLALISAVLSSKIASLIMDSNLRRVLLAEVLLDDSIVSSYDLCGLTSLLKSSKDCWSVEATDGEGLDSILAAGSRGGGAFKSVLEGLIVRIVLAYSRLTGSQVSSYSYKEDFISVYSEVLERISSGLFSKMSVYEKDESLYVRSTSKFAQDVGLDYSKLSSLILIMSVSIRFMENSKILKEREFVDRFSQFYLLLVNLLIINFSKLYLIKERSTGLAEGGSGLETKKMRSGTGRKRTDPRDEQEEQVRESMSCFISGVLGGDVLASHGLVNQGWLSGGERRGQAWREEGLSVWRLESSISTLVSVISLKLNSKRLKELVLLIKRLVHRNEESCLSKISKVASSPEKKSVRECYGEISSCSDLSLVKDIYSSRIWILVLLGIVETTGEYGIYCLIDDIVVDIKAISDLTQMNALSCVQNITIDQYNKVESGHKKRGGSADQQISRLDHLRNDFGWYWYHLGVYNLILVKTIYLKLSSERTRELKEEVPSSMENYLVSPIITNLDMFALFDPATTLSDSGCGRQWDIVLGEIWLSSVKYFRDSDLILAGMIRSLVNKVKNGNDKVRVFSGEVLLRIWKDEICSISVLPYLSDILPALKELLSDHSEELVSTAKLIIKKIEERTGEDISKQLC